MRLAIGGAMLIAGMAAGTLVHAQASDPVAVLVDAGAPAQVTDGVAPVTPGNTRRDPRTGVIDVMLSPDPALAARAIVDPDARDTVAGMLRRLHATGAAAGLAGVLYDNRDSGHSVLDRARYPQLAHTRYDDTLTAQGLHHGVAGRVRFPFPVVGNSSTALTQGPLARSLGRLAVGDQAAALRSYRLFVSNHLYIYPEHRDYDPETGDRLLGNVPFVLLSQGSSWSDAPFIDTALAIIAALSPDTRRAAEASGRLPATVQAVLRRTLDGVNGDAQYLSPAAHPPVIDGARLRPALAVRLANSMTPETLPPLVSLEVDRDFAARPGVDYLAENLGEVLYTTPMAVGRAWRSFEHDRTITLRADALPAPRDDADLTFHWILLQGDPARVTLRPRDAAGRVADIDIAWHDRLPVAPGAAMTTPRVDIAVIADAGGVMSAPAVFSVLFPTHQARVYRRDPTGRTLLAALDHARPDAAGRYADPAVWPTAPWRDVLIRDASGRLRGVQRTRADGQRERLTRDPGGWSVDGTPVRHMARPDPAGVLGLQLHRR